MRVFSTLSEPSEYATRDPSWERTTRYGLTVLVRTNVYVELVQL